MPVFTQYGTGKRTVKTVAGLPDRWGRGAYVRLSGLLDQAKVLDQRRADMLLRGKASAAEVERLATRAAEAREEYRKLAALIDEVIDGPVKVDATDAQLCIMAERFAGDCAAAVAVDGIEFAPFGLDVEAPGDGVGPRQYGRRAAGLSPRDRMSEICRTRGIESPDLDDDAAAVARMVDAKWWRKQLRRTHGRRLEHAAMRLGFVSVRTGSYCSDETVSRRRNQVARNAAALKATMLRNLDTGEEISLADVAARGMSNPANRKGELMTRMAGCEAIAKELGHVGLFVTLTCPSKYHAVLERTGTRNPKYQGATPDEAQAYLNRTWARIRAQLARDGIAPYGFRIAEPHHDGCPHWHMLVFLPESDLHTVEGVGPTNTYRAEGFGPALTGDRVEGFGPTRRGGPLWIKTLGPLMFPASGPLWLKRGFEDTLRRYALEEDGDEPGAVRNRVKVVRIDPARGSATGYIMKYIGKNIDDSQGAAFDDEGQASGGEIAGEAMTPCHRVDAWASVWGIRQFQGLGMPPVTVWRELRRVKEDHDDAPDYVKRALTASRRIERTDQESGEVEVVKAADYAEYIRAQGGVNMGRAYLVHMAWRGGLTPGRYGVTVREVPAGVVAVESWGTLYKSARYEWESAGRKAAPGARGAGVPRSPLNNCTPWSADAAEVVDLVDLVDLEDADWWASDDFARVFVEPDDVQAHLEAAIEAARDMWERSDAVQVERLDERNTKFREREAARAAAAAAIHAARHTAAGNQRSRA